MDLRVRLDVLGKRKKTLVLSGIWNSDRIAHSLFTVLTILPRLSSRIIVEKII